jgi:hypothetical protein
MNINWDVTVRFNPTSLEPSTHGVPIPSYGNYGGPNYSAGVEGGTTPELADLNPSDPSTYPVDSLDWLFWAHDLVYQHFKDGTATQADTFQADVNLVETMYAMPQTDPEALLFEGLATLTILGKILTSPDELAFVQTLPPQEQALVEVLAPQAALQNLEIGLAETSGSESRSLQGAVHVFEAHFGDLLLM